MIHSARIQRDADVAVQLGLSGAKSAENAVSGAAAEQPHDFLPP